MKFVDTHAHLDFDYDEGMTVKKILQEAKDIGVTKIITIGSSVDSLEKISSISSSNEEVFYSLGIHPHDAKDFNVDIENRIKELKNKKCVAIGEIGLDFHYDHSPRDIQKKVFIRQTEIARDLGLPIIIHIRQADDLAFDILKSEYKDHCNGVLHCYSGSKSELRKYLDLGMFVSFTGIVTFEKAIDIQESVAYAPNDRIMLETDSPYLAPIPYRGKKNYPKYIPVIAQKIADIKNQKIEEVAKYSTDNAVKLFGI
jgi:TatD DNase family protein